MIRAFLLVTLLGAALGLILPAPGRQASEPVAATPSRDPVESTAPGPAFGPRETRVDRSADGHFYVEGLVNGQKVRFLVDTGASSVALTVADARRVGASFSPAEFQVVGAGASGPVRGQSVRLSRVELDGKSASGVPGAVVEGLHISLLGQSFLSRMELVQMSGGEMIIR